MRSRTLRVLAYHASRDAVPLYAVYALLFAEHGLSAGQISSLFVIWSVTAFVAEGLLTLAIATAATLRIYEAPIGYGWRGLIVLAISLVAGLIFGGLTVGSIVYRTITGKARRQVEVSADSMSTLTENSTESSALRT